MCPKIERFAEMREDFQMWFRNLNSMLRLLHILQRSNISWHMSDTTYTRDDMTPVLLRKFLNFAWNPLFQKSSEKMKRNGGCNCRAQQCHHESWCQSWISIILHYTVFFLSKMTQNWSATILFLRESRHKCTVGSIFNFHSKAELNSIFIRVPIVQYGKQKILK